MIKIAMISDIHGNFVDVDKSDLLIIAGDLCPVSGSHEVYFQRNWLKTKFCSYIKAWNETCDKIIYIGGNHDFALDDPSHFKTVNEIEEKTSAIYLNEACAWLDELAIWGDPHVSNLDGWAFNCNEPEMGIIYENIPSGVDILITHQPPNGILDNDFYHYGSTSLRREVLQRIKPKIHVFGHCHHGNENNGIEEIGGIKFINAAVLDDTYSLVNPPIYIEV